MKSLPKKLRRTVYLIFFLHSIDLGVFIQRARKEIWTDLKYHEN